MKLPDIQLCLSWVILPASSIKNQKQILKVQKKFSSITHGNETILTLCQESHTQKSARISFFHPATAAKNKSGDISGGPVDVIPHS